VNAAVTPVIRVWFNPQLDSRDFMIPGVLALLQSGRLELPPDLLKPVTDLELRDRRRTCLLLGVGPNVDGQDAERIHK